MPKPYALLSLVLAACAAQSVPYRYQASLQRPDTPAKQALIAVADLTDARPYGDGVRDPKSFFYKVKQSDPRLASYFYRDFIKKPAALTHDRQDFTAINRAMRDLLTQELTFTGAKIVTLNAALAPRDPAAITKAAQAAGAQYLITGRLKELWIMTDAPPIKNGEDAKFLAHFNADFSLALVRVRDDEKLWEHTFSDRSAQPYSSAMDREAWRASAVDFFFHEVLPPLLRQGAGFALDQIEMDLARSQAVLL